MSWLPKLCEILSMVLSFACRPVSRIGAAVTFVQSQIWTAFCPAKSSTASQATSCAFVVVLSRCGIQSSPFWDIISWSIENRQISCVTGRVDVAGGTGYCLRRVAYGNDDRKISSIILAFAIKVF
ncbi:MAG: hypothetical protein EZS28_026222 [Streblomastix strix]|uniref:Secreted protein n=1 Tax=Streblomastix strix TaxID=222440 RepID=A0A5J4V754_9EUKA|nr:MAG: hypothetical protein EZS28_026222 [Streblomastix strix]